MELAEIYATKIEPEPNSGCWIWVGARFIGQGYGMSARRVHGRHTCLYAHRVVYESVVGPIQDDLELDHKCRNKACVNPAHLEEVTHEENMRRAQREMCKRGHPIAMHGSKRRCLLCEYLTRDARAGAA